MIRNHIHPPLNHTHCITLRGSLKKALPISSSNATLDHLYMTETLQDNHQKKTCLKMPQTARTDKALCKTQMLVSSLLQGFCLPELLIHIMPAQTSQHQQRCSLWTLTWSNREPLQSRCACRLSGQVSALKHAHLLAGGPLSCSTACCGTVSSCTALKQTQSHYLQTELWGTHGQEHFLLYQGEWEQNQDTVRDNKQC